MHRAGIDTRRRGATRPATHGGRAARLARLWWFLAALATAPAHAGEMHLLVNGKALHFEKRAGTAYNESNWGAGLQYDWSDPARHWVPFVTAAGFDDSNGNASYYAGGGLLRRLRFGGRLSGWHADAGVVGFLMTRKGYKDGDPFPGLLPAFSIGTDRAALNVSYVPKVDPKAVPLIFLQLKLKLGDF